MVVAPTGPAWEIKTITLHLEAPQGRWLLGPRLARAKTGGDGTCRWDIDG